MLVELFTVGGFFFWIITALALVSCILALDKNNSVGAFFSIGVYLLAIHLFGNARFVYWFYDHPWHSLWLALGYIVIGTVWAVAKWWLFVKDQATSINEGYSREKENFYRSRNIVEPLTEPVPSKYVEEFKRHMSSFTFFAPRVSEYKERIVTWMSFWPLSFIWTLLDDFVKRIFVSIYNFTSQTMQSISNRLFAPLREQFLRDIHHHDSAQT